jgi:2-polyprenyl-3-methyl-5-hydroxy-6-metoxy-1,4-benzoquinol methylase
MPTATHLHPAHRPCPVCANGLVEVLHHQRFVLPTENPLPRSFDVVWCPACGFAYADTPASQATYDRYYAEFSKYEDTLTSTGGGHSPEDLRRLAETASTIAGVVPNSSARVLDIGCANGGLLAALKPLGYGNLVGVDPSAACCERTRRACGGQAMAGSLRQLPPSLGAFDVVILSHVLEHVLDLRASVRELPALLTGSGVVYVEVPDAKRYADCLVAPFQDFNTEHINHFGLASLRNLLATAGLSFVSGGTKEILADAGWRYPAVFGFFRRTNTPPHLPPAQWELDGAFRERLLDYIERSREQLQQIETRIAPLIKQGPLIVWGTGQLTLKLLAETSLGRARIAAFVDGNPINQNKELIGVPVVAPEAIASLKHPILISTLLHQRAITERIRQQLQLTNPIITLAPDAKPDPTPS